MTIFRLSIDASIKEGSNPMARSKTTPAAPPIGEHPSGLEPHLRRLDRQHAQWQEEQTEGIDELKRAWAPAVTKAQVILAQLERLKQEHGPVVAELAARDFASVPPSPQNLNALAAIENACREVQALWQGPMDDLQRLVREVEALSPRTLALFQAHTEAFHFFLKNHPHAPRAIEDLVKRLQHTVEALTARLDVSDDEDVYEPILRLPAPQPLVPEVEMA
jgi:hypothetical protein